MATSKNPTNFADFMKFFEPENFAKMFDPKSMMESFGMKAGDMDPTAAMTNAKDQFDAMVQSNEAAAASYRDLMEKQTQIFRDLTSEAAKQMQSGETKDGGELYQASAKRAFELMTELSEAARDANVKALDAVQSQVAQAMKDLTSKG